MIEDIIDEIVILRIPTIATIVFTVILLVIFLYIMKDLSVTGKYSKTLGLFVGLKDRSALHLCFAWIKFVFFSATLCAMQYATTGHYLIIGFLIIVSAFLAKEKRLITMEIVGGLLVIASTWVCSVFVDYINNVRSDIYVIGAYWIIAIFMILCSSVVFLYEVMSISRERSAFETNWDKE